MQIDFEMCYSSYSKNPKYWTLKKAEIIIFVLSHIDVNFTKVKLYCTLDEAYHSQKMLKPMPIMRKSKVD